MLDLVTSTGPRKPSRADAKPLADGTGTRSPDQTVYAEASYGQNRFGWSRLESLTDGRFQYIRAPREELYDLERDPRQRDNIIGEAGTPRPALDEMPEEIIVARRSELKRLLGDSDEARVETEPGVEPPVHPADPKDKRQISEQYRAALALKAERKWTQAIELLQKVVHEEPDAAGIWSQLGQLAAQAERYGVAMDGLQRLVALKPLDAEGFLGAANVALKTRKFDDAQEYAERAAEAGSRDPRRLTEAHAVLANIALARHDAEAARNEAALVKQSDPASVWPLFVDARLLHDESNDDDALPLLERANLELKKSRGAPIPDLHYLTGEALIQVGRYPEAEAQLREELRSFPHNVRASAALAMLYQSTGQLESAARVVSDLPRITPTPDSYALAAKLWTSLGDRKQAAQVRADAKQAFSNRRSAH